jgi:hypothetical protein
MTRGLSFVAWALCASTLPGWSAELASVRPAPGTAATFGAPTIATPALAPAGPPVIAPATVPGAAPDEKPTATPPLETLEPLEEIIIEAPEPRFVAPTRRDRIGRIWAPVYLNGHGPFRLVLDSGASHSGIIQAVADSLGLPHDPNSTVLLRGVTGSAEVPLVTVDTFEVGDLLIASPTSLPIVTDALGGAQGILGTNGLLDRRIMVDFRHDMISIARSHSERASFGYITIPFKLLRGQLLAVDAHVGNVRTTAIIDTGGQVSIANNSLRDALWRERSRMRGKHGEIEGVTTDFQEGDTAASPPIDLGGITLRDATVTFGDMHIFEHWQLTQQPVILIGMDALGLFDTLIIDYKRRELQISMHSAPAFTMLAPGTR